MVPVRPRTLSAVAAIVLAAGGLAVASAIATQGPTAAPGPVLRVVDETVIVTGELYPTSSEQPDPDQVATGVLDLEALNDAGTPTSAKRPVRLVAECTNCTHSATAAAQFDDLIVEVLDDSGITVYQGPLSQLNAKLPDPDKAEVKVWLADTGQPQAQGIVSEWSFTATTE